MTILDDIIANKQSEVASLPDVDASSLQPSERDFLAAFQPGRLGIIAETKAHSPSEGVICADYNPNEISREYQAGGADAISVLCDQKYFHGHLNHLQQVRDAVDLPLLCKEFIIDAKQVKLARQSGADACLLIMSVLSDAQATSLKQCIESFGMVALIEIYNEDELQRALTLDPQLIGINNRNLKTFDVNLQHSADLCDKIPAPIKVIAASGCSTPEDIQQLPKRIDGLLIGTALMRSDDRVDLLQRLRKAR